jgi:hypothetical protein
VHADGGLEEPAVGDVGRLAAGRACLAREVERLPYLGLTVVRDERQDQVDVAFGEGCSCGAHHGTVEGIAMRGHVATSSGLHLDRSVRRRGSSE